MRTAEERVQARLEQKMREHGLTQRFLAQEVGLTDSAISYIRRGRKMPSLRTAMKIAAVLGCTVEWLFGPYARQRRKEA